jgi:hypothetical protein
VSGGALGPRLLHEVFVVEAWISDYYYGRSQFVSYRECYITIDRR